MRISSGMFHGINTSYLLNGRRPNLLSTANLPTNVSNQLNKLMADAAQFVADAKPRATQLQNTLANLTSVLNKQTAVSEDNDVFWVKSFTGTKVPETSVLVEQVATTQRNEGTAMQSSTKSIPRGSYRFEIEVDGKKHQISFSTTDNLTNREFQQRMADAVNQANIGVTASISTSGNLSTLNLETKTTGSGVNGQPRFTIRDITGNVVEATGVTNMARQGQNTIFSVNGGEKRTSASNEVNLSGGLNITLVKSSDKAVSISTGKDSIGTQNGLRQMVNQYNALLETARENSIDRNTQRLVRDLESAIRRNRNSLQQMGISTNKNGYLTIDADKMRTATEDGTVGKVLGSSNGRTSAFISSLNTIADNVSKNPLRYINASVTRMPGFNSALIAASGGSGKSNQQQSLMDAYYPDDLVSHLLNSLR